MTKIPDLPEELELEILSRVLAKSLAKLRTTCKRWYALFRDPKFIEKNLRKAQRETMLQIHSAGVYSVNDDLHGIYNSVDPSIEFTGRLRSLNDSEDLKISKIFHCDGLILCSTKGSTRIVVWNPCTGQTTRIKPRIRYRIEDTYALGYVKSNSCDHSYKILRSCYYENDQMLRVAEFEIYEFSSDSWRVLDYFTRDCGVFCDGMSLKGNTYWVAGDEETGFFMMYFDFTTEKFGRLPLPFQSFDPEDTACLSVVKEEKLSVLHQNFLEFSIVMRIWVTSKIDEAKDLSWSNFVLVVDYDKFNLPYVGNVTSFLLDEENKVAVCCDVSGSDDKFRARIYIVGENMYKQVYEESRKEFTKGFILNWPLLLTYVPSLVHIQKGAPKRQKKRKHKEAQTGGQLCNKRYIKEKLKHNAYQKAFDGVKED